MKAATVANVKAHLSSLLAQVEAGEDLIITRRGKPVARLVAEPHAAKVDWSDLRAWVDSVPNAGPTVAEMREQNLL